MEEFVIPSFLTDGCDADTIHQKMMQQLPADIDTSEGGFPWDFTRPTALVSAELLEYYSVELVRVMFPQWSYGDYLDTLAETVGLARREATYAKVTIRVEGETGVYIPKGTVFATEDVDEIPSIEFSSTEDKFILLDGKVEVDAVAVEPGTSSNVGANSISIMSIPIAGIETITNLAPATGGTDIEDDDSLRVRVLTACRAENKSFAGTMADYKRWGEEVAGIGSVVVVPEAETGTVKLVCMDANGVGASTELLNAVYNHIMRPDNPYERLAPINAKIVVAAPAPLNLEYLISATLKQGYSYDDVEAEFRAKLEEYYKSCMTTGIIRYNKVYAALASVEGIEDFESLSVNGGFTNITFNEGEYPFTKSIDFELEGGVS